jgi:aminopeptidase-like protein
VSSQHVSDAVDEEAGRGPSTSLGAARAALDRDEVGRRLHAQVSELYPICRSITGDGVRSTLRIVQRELPITIHEVPSGTQAFDWQVPLEWNIRDAWVKNSRGERIVDFRAHNLHVVNYSRPVRMRVSRSELLRHLHSVPAQPDVIPYRTTYYADDWGFCVRHSLLAALTESHYDVCIEASLDRGSLTYGEYAIPGMRAEEVLFSCHICHPSLANDNLSAIVVAAQLARQLSRVATRYSYRFLFIPGTIGAITWLSRNEEQVARVRAGLVLTCLGDAGPFTYKRSSRGDTEIDRVVAHVLRHAGVACEVRDFSPYGYDERQFCSPGFDLAVGRLSRSVHGEFPEYHTSADDLAFVTPAALADSYAMLLAIVDAFEANRAFRNLSPKGEPQLGRRGLYAAIGGTDRGAREMAMLWVLNQANGTRTLLDIAERAALPLDRVHEAAVLLTEHGLLAPCHN